MKGGTRRNRDEIAQWEVTIVVIGGAMLLVVIVLLTWVVGELIRYAMA